MLTFRDRLGLWIQLQLSRALAPITYYGTVTWMKFIRRYSIPGLKEARKEFSALQSKGDGPVLLCGNHLTAIDSLLIMWALSPGWKCFVKKSLMPWNLPDKQNFSGNIYIRVACYIGRCLPITRGGPRDEVKKVLSKVNSLLGKGHSILIFPEGGRSRVGHVDTENFSYGVGSILQEAPEARVVCVFFRGKRQAQFSNLPHRGDEFHIELKEIAPRSASPGLRGAREISTQIVHTLAEMEQRYFKENSLAHR